MPTHELWLAGPLGFGVDMALRATAILLGALLFAWVGRRSAATVRHGVWTAAMVVLCALPFLTWMLPAVPVPGLPERASSGWVRVESVEPPAVPPQAGLPEARVPVGDDPDARGPEIPARAAPATVPAGQQGRPGWLNLLYLLWLAGAALMAIPLGLGTARAAHLIRSASPVRDSDWLGLLRKLQRSLRVRRSVALRTSPSSRVALAGGLLRPAVILPPGALRWSAERRELVLLHELIHVKRLDHLRQLLGRVVLCVYWFHPLVWPAVRMAARAREEACDEAVLACGFRPSVYARHLVELADRQALPVPAFARLEHPQLERRIMAIVRFRPHASRRHGIAVLAAVLLTLGWGLLVAAAAPVQSLPAEPEPTMAADPPPAPVPPAVTPPTVPDSVAPEPPAAPEPPVAPGAPAVLRTPEVPGPPAPPLAPQPGCPAVADIEGREGPTMAREEDGRRTVIVRLDGVLLCREVVGEVRFHEDGAPIESMADGAEVRLVALDEGRSWRMAITSTSGEAEHRWIVDGQERPFDDEAREWRDAMLVVLEGRAQAGGIRGQAGRLRGEIGRIRGQEGRIQGEIGRIRGDVGRLQGELGRLQAAEVMQERQRELRERLAEVTERRDASLAERRLELEERLREHREASTARIALLEAERVAIDAEARIREVEARLGELSVERRIEAIDGRVAPAERRLLGILRR